MAHCGLNYCLNSLVGLANRGKARREGISRIASYLLVCTLLCGTVFHNMVNGQFLRTISVGVEAGFGGWRNGAKRGVVGGVRFLAIAFEKKTS